MMPILPAHDPEIEQAKRDIKAQAEAKEAALRATREAEAAKQREAKAIAEALAARNGHVKRTPIPPKGDGPVVEETQEEKPKLRIVRTPVPPVEAPDETVDEDAEPTVDVIRCRLTLAEGPGDICRIIQQLRRDEDREVFFEMVVHILAGVEHDVERTQWLKVACQTFHYKKQRLIRDLVSYERDRLVRLRERGVIAGPSEREAIVRSMSDVKSKRLRWLWDKWLPRGKLTLLVGNPDEAKSLITIMLAAAHSRGMAWPDGGKAEKGDWLMLFCEDDAEDTVRPRLDAVNADPARVKWLEAVKDDTGAEVQFNLERDVDLLEGQVTPTTLGVSIDTLTSYFPSGRNSWKDEDVRAVLMPLVKLAQKTQLALVGVMHLNKASEHNALYRVMNSIGFVGVSRHVLLVGPHPDTKGRRVLVRAKNNLTAKTEDALIFDVVGREVTTEDGPTRVAAIQWVTQDPLLMTPPTANQLLAQTRAGRPDTDLQDAKLFLQSCFADVEAWRSKDIRAAARQAGACGERTLKDAKKLLGVGSFKEGYHPTVWWWTKPHMAPASAVVRTKLREEEQQREREAQKPTREPVR